MARYASPETVVEGVLPHVCSRPSETLRLVAVVDADELPDHAAAWQDLADHALEPNPFYEPWMLIPATRAFGQGEDLVFVFLYRDGARGSQLCGFFPLQRRRFKGVPLLGLWQHLHCFSCTPLLRSDDASACFEALFDWVHHDSRTGGLLELNQVPGEGPFHHALTDFVYERDALTFVVESCTRALWRAREDTDSYVRLALSPGGRQDFRRKRKRLGELGRLEFKALQFDEAVDNWIQQFLSLEASGWKGREHTALATIPSERGYFQEIAAAAFGRGQLQMLGLFLENNPIALKCNFLAGQGAFVFKPAYDEQFGRYSPGALLELDNMDLCHRSTPPVRWMDSCAAHDNPMWNRLWIDRRVIQTILVSTGTRRGDLVVSLRPLLRWAGRSVATSR